MKVLSWDGSDFDLRKKTYLTHEVLKKQYAQYHKLKIQYDSNANQNHLHHPMVLIITLGYDAHQDLIDDE